MIPFFGLQREHIKYKDLYLDLFEEVLDDGRVLQGIEVESLEKKMAGYCGRDYAVAVNSCTDALYFALVASGIGPGDEVLVTDFSFVASASCILRAGAKPVFVDIREDNYNMDIYKAELTEKTKAMIFVNLYGRMMNPIEVTQFCANNKLILIEDAAQSLGSMFDGFRSGRNGFISCLSFDPTKVLGAPGSGGMVLTNNSRVAEDIRRLRYHGKGQDGFSSLGYNSQMPSSTAYILMAKADMNAMWKSRRIHIANYYSANISSNRGWPI